MTIRAALLALLLLAPLALAGAATWTDPAGDVRMTLQGQPLPPGVTCRDDRVDLVGAAASSDDNAIVFTLTFADRAAAPACALDALGTPMTLRAGTPRISLEFGPVYAGEYIVIDNYHASHCFAEISVRGVFAQPACAVDTVGDDVIFSIPTMAWGYDFETETDLGLVDLRTIDWPRGIVDVRVGNFFGPTGPGIVARDTLELGVYDP